MKFECFVSGKKCCACLRGIVYERLLKKFLVFCYFLLVRRSMQLGEVTLGFPPCWSMSMWILQAANRIP